ncbi:predicted protein [Nematostella vectensis]|uniref:Replication termination factor 2 n=1 Tax=Nematostella vectensis TaxID=45351 RepID=A7RZE6_NEMVE|nr:predicted protein [Nematostella vectensis]|eukprot:XP_001635139.1 predicted protein [Nematostella vectensis]
MGCDGGTIPTRDELVRMKKAPEKVEKNYELNAKWFHCAISQEQLHSPIVSCELGNLYNKEKLLEFLLDRSSATSDVANHIRNLKDTKQLNLTVNPAFEQKTKEQAGGYLDFQASQYICPVVGIEMNGRYKFCFLWKCGCVFSERALKEVKSVVCHKCGKTFSQEDVVVINGSEDEVEIMKEKMNARRLKAKQEKKAKKAPKSAETTTSASPSAGPSKPEIPFKKPKLDSKPGVNGASSRSVSSKKGKSPKVNVTIPTELSKYKTVAEDPNASKVYKSLFASGHEKRPEHLKSNWVTYHSYGGYHI